MHHLLALALLLALPATAADTTWPDLSSPPKASAGDGRKDAALVIGIESYAAAQPIPGARDNALAWVSWLSDARRVPLVKPLFNQQAVKEDMLSAAVQVAGQVRPGGTLWLVYIGHGAPAREGDDGLLVGWDAQQTASSIEARGLRQSELIAAIEGALPASARAVIVLDACFSGKTASGDLAPGLAPLKPVEARVSSSRVTMLTAAKSNEYAGPLADGRRPAFSYLALGALRGWGDRNEDGAVSASEAHAYASRALLQTVTGRTQTPTLAGEDVELAMGREQGPDLVGLSVAAPEAVPMGAAQIDLGGGRTDFAALAAQAQAADAAQARAEAAALAAAQAYAKEQRKQLDAAAATVRSQASRDFAAIAGLVSSPTASARPVLEAYAATYGAASVTVGDTTERVSVPELARVQAALAVVSTPTATPTSTQQTGKLGYDLVRIPAGSFTMGSPSSEEGRDSDETQHTVRLTQDFWLGKTEVTQGLWEEVMGENPSKTGRRVWDNDKDGTGDDMGVCSAVGDISLVDPDYPVMCVSWCDAVVFANTLSKQEGLVAAYVLPSGFTSGMSYAQCKSRADEVRWTSSASGYRLPTEAEWEHAGRAVEHARFAGAESDASLCRVGNVKDTSTAGKWSNSQDPAPCSDGVPGLAVVGGYAANAWGLHDMTGNVWEWTWDVHGAYPSGSVTDPTGASTGAYRVSRGGSWYYSPAIARLAFRNRNTPGNRNSSLGLRLARSIP